MTNRANLMSMQALRDAKAAMIEFIEEGKLAVMEAEADVQKTVFWLESDRLTHWQVQVRKCHAKVQQAKSDLYRAQMASRDERPSCVLERKMLARAQEAFDHAERKVKDTKRWIQTLQREAILFKAALASFGSLLELDLPNAVAHLERLMDHVEAYASLKAPDAPDAPAPPSDGEGGGS
ncbi:MAG: hypothetical protein KDA22_14290 [Phycisphaerales bacterium]|nr:hypothetical protein [Phycisphaerales bacterium]